MARFALSALAVLAALAFIAASGVMNAFFWAGQGHTQTEGYVLATVSVAGDLLKAVLPVLIGWAVISRRWGYVALAAPLFLVLLAAGFVAALGFVAGNRGDVIGGREAKSARLEQAARDLANLDGELSRLTGYPPIATLEAELARLEQNPRFASSDRCTNATAQASRDICSAYFEAKGKLGAAIEANRLSSKRGELVAEVNRLRAAGAANEADPQAGIFARWLPGKLTTGTVRDGLAVFFAVLVELGAAFGLYLATRHGGPAMADNRLSPKAEEVNLSVLPVIDKARETRISPPVREANLRLVDVGQPTENASENRLTASPPLIPRRFKPSEKWITAPPRSRLTG